MHTCCEVTVTQLHHHHRYTASKPWKPNVFSCPPLAVQFVPCKQKKNGHGDWVGIDTDSPRHMVVPMASSSLSNDDIDICASTSSNSQILDREAAKGSGTTARGRRLLKIREEKRKREYDRLHNYPAWAKVLEDACKNDSELRAVLGDSIGNPELMRKKVEERVRRKGRDFQKSKTGSVLAFKVSFRDFNPVDSYIWFELFGSPSDRDVDLIGSVIQSWYVMGRLGAYNSSNLQLANSSLEYNPIYDADKGFNVMPSSFHDISNVEFQDNWGRVWVDLGTSDFFAIDILLNCLTLLSSEYLGIQQVVFGGRSMGDWEEGMTSPEKTLTRTQAQMYTADLCSFQSQGDYRDVPKRNLFPGHLKMYQTVNTRYCISELYPNSRNHHFMPHLFQDIDLAYRNEATFALQRLAISKLLLQLPKFQQRMMSL